MRRCIEWEISREEPPRNHITNKDQHVRSEDEHQDNS